MGMGGGGGRKMWIHPHLGMQQCEIASDVAVSQKTGQMGFLNRWLGMHRSKRIPFLLPISPHPPPPTAVQDHVWHC